VVGGRSLADAGRGSSSGDGHGRLPRPGSGGLRVADTFFDITDLVAYLSAHGGVTGIQRVEARILSHLARTGTESQAWCVTADPSGSGYRAWRLAEVFRGDHSNELTALTRLVEEPARGPLPSRKAVRRHLNRIGARGWRRAAGKVDIYTRAVLSPGSLERQGIRIANETPPPAARHLRELPADGTLVLLGAGWNDLAVTVAARRHARAGGRVVHWVHDLIPLVRPEFFEDELREVFARHFTAALDYTSEFVCISRHTQADLEAFLEARGRRIPSTVVPLAHQFADFPRNARGCRPANRRLEHWGGPGREFLLCVGTLEVRKNGVALLEAWLRLREELGEATPHLLLCGRRGWRMEPFFALRDRHRWLRQKVHILSGADDADLAALHERSLASIYPSFYEGWGLPVGEAAWFGRACITSGESSLPEVCGSLADYVDPRSPASIAAAVRQLTLDTSWRAWRERLIAAAPLRTWGDVADEFGAALAAPRGATGRVRRAA
jgi:glycosyltransferase involved in cell wall biosynthesis